MTGWLIGCLVAAAAVVFALAALYALPFAAKKVSQRRLAARCRERGVLVLTYDDGPSRTLTPRLIEELGRAGAKATFFASGGSAGDHADILDLVQGEGHEIGCHAQWHRNAWRVGPLAALEDARTGFRSLRRWVAPDGLFRPPSGRIDLLTWAFLFASGTKIGWWTVDSGDTHDVLPDPASVSERIVSGNGGVVLMHDLEREPARNTYVLELTRGLLAAARENGLSIRPLGSVLHEEESAS